MRYADAYCTYTELNNPHRYVFTGPCRVTKKRVSVTIPGAELYAYRRGKLIQDAMPSVSDGDREFLMSGTSQEGWNKLFPKEDDDALET